MIKKLYIWLPLFLFLNFCAMSAALHEQLPASAIEETKPANFMVVYPKDNATIFAPSTFLIGSINSGENINCNGSAIKTNKDGFFAHLVKLQVGDNEFILQTSNNASRVLHIKRALKLRPLDMNNLEMDKEAIEPKENITVTTGDTIPLAVRATPNALVTALIGKHKIKLQAANKTQLNTNTDFAYGKSLQNVPESDPALNVGSYRVSPSDNFYHLPIEYTAEKDGRTVHMLAVGKITVNNDLQAATTLNTDTIVRVGPDKSRVTPLPKNVKLLIDGEIGDWARCLLAPDHHVYILKKDLSPSETTISAPNTVVRTVNISESNNGATISIPLNQCLPFQIEQQINPNKLVLRIYGATADTDWITQSPTTSALIDHVSWKQSADQIYELTIHLKEKRQWGFWTNYENQTLVLHIKAPPHLVSSEKPLSGLVICLDPGHGGSETGSMGPSGISESQINLSIALNLKNLLTASGANVIMTRETDVNPSLSERVQTAIDNHSDLLLSIHNNALPDGRDPLTDHGTSTYWYQPQSIELAQRLRQCLLNEVKFADFGTFYQNLALTRPSNMPAVLVEVGFMINPDEYSQLITSSLQIKAAQALQEGIISYLKDTTVPTASK